MKTIDQLKKKRKEIDLLDLKLLRLIDRRLSIALVIGKIKKEIGLKTYDPAREKEVLKKLIGKNKGMLKEKDLKKIFSTIMKICRQSQNLPVDPPVSRKAGLREGRSTLVRSDKVSQSSL